MTSDGNAQDGSDDTAEQDDDGGWDEFLESGLDELWYADVPEDEKRALRERFGLPDVATQLRTTVVQSFNDPRILDFEPFYRQGYVYVQQAIHLLDTAVEKAEREEFAPIAAELRTEIAEQRAAVEQFAEEHRERHVAYREVMDGGVQAEIDAGWTQTLASIRTTTQQVDDHILRSNATWLATKRGIADANYSSWLNGFMR